MTLAYAIEALDPCLKFPGRRWSILWLVYIFKTPSSAHSHKTVYCMMITGRWYATLRVSATARAKSTRKSQPQNSHPFQLKKHLWFIRRVVFWCVLLLLAEMFYLWWLVMLPLGNCIHVPLVKRLLGQTFYFLVLLLLREIFHLWWSCNRVIVHIGDFGEVDTGSNVLLLVKLLLGQMFHC